MQIRPEPRPFDVEYLDNPTQSELRELAVANTPAVQVTQAGSLNKVSRNKARMAKYTYVIAPESAAGDWSQNVIGEERAREIIARQNDYIAEKGQLIAIDGYVGLGERAFGATCFTRSRGPTSPGCSRCWRSRAPTSRTRSVSRNLSRPRSG